MKKTIFLLPAIVIMVACRNTPKTDTTQTKITILGENSATIQAMARLEKNYEALNPNLNLEFKPNSFDDAFSKANQDFTNRTGLYDIVMQYNLSLSSFVRNNYIFGIEEAMKDMPDSLQAFEKNLFPNAWKEVGFYKDDKMQEALKVGYPFATNTMLLMYNKNLFDDAQQKAAYQKKYNQALTIPTTWEQFAQIAQFFTQPELGTSGVCLEGASGGWVYCEWMNFLFGMGGKVMDKQYGWEGNAQSKILLNSPEALKALKLYKSLKPYNSGNFANVEQALQMKIMKEGKTAMILAWSDMIYPSIYENNQFDNRFGFAPVPGNKSVLGGGAFFLNRHSKNPKAAAKYVLDLMQPPIQLELAKKGLCSGLKTVYEDAEVKKMPYTQALYTSLDRGGVILEAGPDANLISEKITTYLQKVWNDELTPEQALPQLQAEIETGRTNLFETLKKETIR